MTRLNCVAALLVITLSTHTARADRIGALASPEERAIRVPVVIVGKVTAIEKEPVDAPLYPGATNKVAHKIAVVKVVTGLAGAEGVTHFKVGFVPRGTGGIRAGRGPDNPNLMEGEEWLFFLTKYPTGEFHVIPYLTPPVETTDRNYKDFLERTKKLLALLADPVKSLKAEKAEDRYAAAVALILKYRTVPEGVRDVDPVAIPAEESRLALKALTEGVWVANDKNPLHGMQAYHMLGLTATDGWKQPRAEGNDYPELVRSAFTKWVDGLGKEYRIKKVVPKK